MHNFIATCSSPSFLSPLLLIALKTALSFLLPHQLEKFKFVLDFKIKELKRQIEPRETEIGSMKEQIKEMDRELEQVTPSIKLFKSVERYPC